MKLAGEAVRDYTDAYGGNHMISIGVAGWGCVARSEVLVSTNNEVSLIKFYKEPFTGAHHCTQTKRM